MRSSPRYHKNRLNLRRPGADDAKGTKTKDGNRKNAHTTEVAEQTSTTLKATRTSSSSSSTATTTTSSSSAAATTKKATAAQTTSTKAASSSTKKSSKSTAAAGKSTTRTSTVSGASSTATIAASTDSGSSTTRAIIGVGASVAAVLIVAVGLWFLRKWLLQKHAAKRQAWRASLRSQLEAKRNTYADISGATVEKDASSLRPLIAQRGMDTPITPSSPAFPSPPAPAVIPAAVVLNVNATTAPASSKASVSKPSPLALNANAASATISPPLMSPGLSIPALSVTPAGATSPVVLAASPTVPRGGPRHQAAMVLRTFVPTLSDELPVTIGDTVWIEESFDDGWCSCTNNNGQAGVVPLECLQSMSRKPREQQMDDQTGGTDYRSSKRQSSLYGSTRASDTY